MQASQTPTLVPLAFAANGTKNVIPEASQIGVTPGAASLNDGFPPLTFTPVAAGGVPPAGADFNGVLNLITASIRWAHGGGLYAFSSSFAVDANVTGYPQGAELLSADLQGTWLSLNDSNTDNPDTGAGTKWVPGRAYGVTSVTGLTNANVTLTPAQAAKNRITLAGTLTGNVQIIFPTWTREWTIVNNTTGAFSVTAKTSAGTGITIPQNGSPTKIVGDGTNITQLPENVASATQGTHAVQLQQMQAAQGNYANIVLVSASTTLTAAQMSGNAIDCFAASGSTLTLPTLSTLTAGKTTKIYNYGSGTLIVQTNGTSGDFIYNGLSSSLTSITLQQGDDLELVARGTHEIDIVGGSAMRQFYPLTVGPATASQHAVQFGQVAGVVGQVRNLLMNVTAASATAMLTADEIIVESALGGLRYCLASFSKTINLATTGAGGMDTGTAPVSGYVAIYAIYNPTTSTAALLATNATSAKVNNVYGGANMPSGYTASALVSVWPTNSSSQFSVATQEDRVISIPDGTVASGTATGTSGNPVALASTVFPPNARHVSGWVSLSNPSANTNSQAVLSSVSGQVIGSRKATFNSATTGGQIQAYANLPITTAQTIYGVVTVNANSCAYIIAVSEYEI